MNYAIEKIISNYFAQLENNIEQFEKVKITKRTLINRIFHERSNIENSLQNIMRFVNEYSRRLTEQQRREVKEFVKFDISSLLNTDAQSNGYNLKDSKIFIVHGNDNRALFEVENFIRNKLSVGHHHVLSDNRLANKTVTQRFEELKGGRNVVFVIISEIDDFEDSMVTSAELLLELGYISAKINNKEGAVVLLKKGNVKLPKNLLSTAILDITEGVGRESDAILAEVAMYLN